MSIAGKGATDFAGRWRYKDDHWEDYRVRPGEVWRVGDAVIGCYDFDQGDDWRALIDAYGYADAVYVDPPRGPGLATGFRTKAAAGGRVNWPAFVDRLAHVATTVTYGPVWCQMGHRWEQEVIDAFARHGRTHVRTYTVGSSFTRPGVAPPKDNPRTCALIHFTGTGAERTLMIAGNVIVGLDGLDDAYTPAKVIENVVRPGGIVADLCTGLGRTPHAALTLGRRYYGMELHPRRVSAALHTLAVLTGDTPERIRP